MASKTTQLGFMCVSRTASRRMVVFPIMAGFGSKGPRADLDAEVAKGGDREGYVLALDAKGSLRAKKLRAKK